MPEARNGFRDLAESGRDLLVVREDGERPPLQEITEMFDPNAVSDASVVNAVGAPWTGW